MEQDNTVLPGEDFFHYDDDDDGFEWFDSLDLLRILLVPLMCFFAYYQSGSRGLRAILECIPGFSLICFFMISGFLVLPEGPDRAKRILRAIKRTAIMFAVMTVFYGIISAVYYGLTGSNIVAALSDPGTKLVNFAAFNVWPFVIGGLVWYVQALLYTYLIVFVLEKLRLLRFDWLIATVLLLFTVATGELSGVLGLSFTLPGCFLTRGLPYVLFGCFVRRKLPALSAINIWVYVSSVVIGILLCIVEGRLLLNRGELVNASHLIGMALIAFGILMLALMLPYEESSVVGYLTEHSRLYLSVMYLVIPAINDGLRSYFVFYPGRLVGVVISWSWAICFVGALAIAIVFGMIFDSIQEIRKEKEFEKSFEKENL